MIGPTFIFASAVFWCGTYKLVNKFYSNCTAEWSCRLVTVLHAIIAVCLAAWCCFIEGPWPFLHPGSSNTRLQVITLCNSIGYFMFDFAWCIYMNTEGPVMLLHHLISILGLSWCIYIDVSAIEMTATIFGAELTNPLLQLRWFLRATGRKGSILYEINDLAFLCSFAALRTGIGTNLLIAHLQHPVPHLSVKMGGLIIYTISWIFMINIAIYAYGKYTVMFKNCCSKIIRFLDSEQNGFVEPAQSENHNGWLSTDSKTFTALNADK